MPSFEEKFLQAELSQAESSTHMDFESAQGCMVLFWSFFKKKTCQCPRERGCNLWNNCFPVTWVGRIICMSLGYAEPLALTRRDVKAPLWGNLSKFQHSRLSLKK